MYQRILVPLDGSRAAEEAIPVAVELAQRSDAEVHLALVHLSVGTEMAAAAVPVDFGELDSLQTEDEAAYLTRVLGHVQLETGARALAYHLHGPIVDALAAHVAEREIDLVVMTTHGRGPVGRLWLGSVADGLIRTAEVPVLLLRSSNDVKRFSGFRRVLLPLDQSPLAEDAIVHAQALMHPEEGQALLLHVTRPAPLMNMAPIPFGMIPDLAAEPAAREQAAAYLERIARRLRRIGLRARSRVRVAASAGVAILEEAHEERVDAIVVTTHGVGGLRRLLLGSVVDKLVRGAEVPVLVCRPRPRKRAPVVRPELAVHQAR
ncbi:MAG: universal stress protein [Gemmatimonadota bacterium]